MRTPWNFKVGLALGGGAARGLAHVGVLRALDRAGIPIDVVTGTSMGSIVGGAYAATRDVSYVEDRVREVVTSEEFQRNRLSFLKESKERRGGLLYSVANLVKRGIVYGVSTVRPSFISAERIAESLAAVLPEVRIQDMPIPFASVALDLEAGEEVVQCHGSLRRAALASSAIPGLLPPVRIDGRVLVDGGWVDKLPVIPAFCLGADMVIAVDISADIEDTEGYDRGVDVMFRANAVKDAALVRVLGRFADVVVEPDVKSLHWADFDRMEFCISEGEEAATRAAPRIREMIQRERWRSVFRPRPGKRFAEHFLRSGELKLCVE